LECCYPQTGFLLLSFCDVVFNITAFLGFQSHGLTLVSVVRFIFSIDAITAVFDVLNLQYPQKHSRSFFDPKKTFAKYGTID
jgi:hypothetical protein